jgi:ABC-type transporter Mla subunit MlaD
MSLKVLQGIYYLLATVAAIAIIVLVCGNLTSVNSITSKADAMMTDTDRRRTTIMATVDQALAKLNDTAGSMDRFSSIINKTDDVITVIDDRRDRLGTVLTDLADGLEATNTLVADFQKNATITFHNILIGVQQNGLRLDIAPNN